MLLTLGEVCRRRLGDTTEEVEAKEHVVGFALWLRAGRVWGKWQYRDRGGCSDPGKTGRADRGSWGQRGTMVQHLSMAF